MSYINNREKKTTMFTTKKTDNGRGGDQWNIYRDGQLVAFVFEEADVERVIDEMVRFPRYAETAHNRYD